MPPATLPQPAWPLTGDSTRRKMEPVTPDAYRSTTGSASTTRRCAVRIPALAAAIGAALGDARTVINVGAGAGAYEPRDHRVLAVEPSRAMIALRPAEAAPCVQAAAEALPFRDGAADASLAVLTVHHWRDQAAGLAELRRVARRRVVAFTWDPAARGGFWLTAEYFPRCSTSTCRASRRWPRSGSASGVPRHAGADPARLPGRVPRRLLAAARGVPRPGVRGAISSFALLGRERLRSGLARLADDLGSGRWEARHGALRGRESLDLGYRLVTAERA